MTFIGFPELISNRYKSVAMDTPNSIASESNLFHFNFSAKSNNSLLHRLYHDVISKLKNLSSPQIQIKHDINGEDVIYDEDRGIIFGNPLLIPECHQSLADEVGLLGGNFVFNKWMITREHILRHQSTGRKKPRRPFLFDRAKSQTNRNGTRYLNVEKSASSTMTR